MNQPMHYIHNGVNYMARSSAPYKCGASAAGDQASTNPDSVTCSDCLDLMKGVSKVSHPNQSYEDAHRLWVLAVRAGETHFSFNDWVTTGHVNEPSSLERHTPPRMVDANGLTDGVFLFHGTHSGLGGVMEVVPMATGNVEFTISANDEHQEGMVFNLSHLDRADLIRALLHDFHYSPERGGPNDG